MAKMMMGQIEHARARLKTIAAEKIGPKPASPKRLSVKDLLEGIIAGTIRVTPALLRTACNDWVAGAEVPTVKEDTHWDHRAQTQRSSFSIERKKLGSIEGYVASIFYSKENDAELERFKNESNVYADRKDIVTREATSVEDQIVLGDQLAAANALTAFAALEI